MKKIVIIGANSFQNPLILKAREMGYETHVFAWQDGSVGEKTADYFYPISIVEKNRIVEECRRIRPDAVATIASDLAMLTVGYVAEKLGLPCNSMECINRSTNKYLMRQAFQEHGISSPKFTRVSEQNVMERIVGMQLPVIVKPTDRSGSRSVTKIEGTGMIDGSLSLETENAILEAVKRAVKDSFENRAIVEEFFEGDEYSFESITDHGVHHMLQITRKYTTNEPHFIETGHMEPAGLEPDMVEQIKSEIFRALDALGITTGAGHSEFRILPDGRIKIIEIGPRMGGDCIGSHLVPLSTGYDFVKMVIEAAAGMPVSFEKSLHSECAGIRFIMNQEDYQFYLHLKEKHPECIVYESDIDDEFSRNVVDSGSRHGYYICVKNSRAEMDEIMK